jgi:hypothetical protein
MAELSAGARKRIPKSNFALPGGGPKGADAYPITDKSHAVAALARVATNGTPSQKSKVRAAVKSKFPDLPSSKGKGKSAAARHNRKTVSGTLANQ